MDQPTLKTRRLSLRPFTPADAESVQSLAGHELVARTTANIPHPYPDGAAEQWISGHEAAWREGSLASFAIELTGSSDLIGAISLMNIKNAVAELGYWIGVPYWAKGYCSEAAAGICSFAESGLGLRRVNAEHVVDNPASGAVLRKVGFVESGARTIENWKGGCEVKVLIYQRRLA